MFNFEKEKHENGASSVIAKNAELITVNHWVAGSSPARGATQDSGKP